MIDMNKKQILETLKKYNFDKDKYLVISGAAMVLLGIKENTSDIDLAVADDYYEYLLKNVSCTFDRVNEFGKVSYTIDNVIDFCTTYYENSKEFIENIPVQQPQKILELKISLNRKKDKKDIKLIKEYMNE